MADTASATRILPGLRKGPFSLPSRLCDTGTVKPDPGKPVKFTLLVTAAPHRENAWQALQFCRAALARGHEVVRVFFYGDGVAHGSALLTPPQDEADVGGAWQALAAEHGIELVVCIAAALRRGLVDADTAAREEKPVANLATGFTVSGLGQFAEAMLDADRVVSFP
jgi:tRNA 2-thiouridine synthesizing protein D